MTVHVINLLRLKCFFLNGNLFPFIIPNLGLFRNAVNLAKGHYSEFAKGHSEFYRVIVKLCYAEAKGHY